VKNEILFTTSYSSIGQLGSNPAFVYDSIKLLPLTIVEIMNKLYIAEETSGFTVITYLCSEEKSSYYNFINEICQANERTIKEDVNSNSELICPKCRKAIKCRLHFSQFNDGCIRSINKVMKLMKDKSND
jgi:hypothetical protein